MLVGEYTYKVSEKKRIALPKKFRDILGKEIIITRGYDDCIMVVNNDQWEKLLEIFSDKPFTSSPVRDTRRFLIGGASEANLDSQGRFVLPKNLKDFADIKNEVVFVGLVDWIEIWDKDKWEKRMDTVKPNASDIAEKLNDKKENE